MYTLSKEFRFEAAHRLMNYIGACSNIHGHTWQGEITIKGTQLDRHGFIMDFKQLKKLINKFIKDFDHAIILNVKDKRLRNLCIENDYKAFTFDEDPTCEVISRWLYRRVYIEIERLKLNIKLVSVTIKETPTSKCTYEG